MHPRDTRLHAEEESRKRQPSLFPAVATSCSAHTRTYHPRRPQDVRNVATPLRVRPHCHLSA